MNRTVRYALLALVFAVGQRNVAAKDVPLAAGNLLQCTIDEPNLSSRSVKVGDPIVCYARPLQEFGCSVFPRGTQLAGRFVEYRDPGRLAGKGWMMLEFDRVILPQGVAPVGTRVVSVRGFHVDSEGRILGRGHRKRDAAEWIIPILWPEKILTLPLRGPRPALKGEHVLTLRLLDDVRLPCGKLGSSWLESAWRIRKDKDSDWEDSAWYPFKKAELEGLENFTPVIPFDTPSLQHATYSAGHEFEAPDSGPRPEGSSANNLPVQARASRDDNAPTVEWALPRVGFVGTCTWTPAMLPLSRVLGK